MTGDDLDVIVSSPKERIVTSGTAVLLDSLFLQSTFEISVELEAKRTSFEINLPEWLITFSSFLKDHNQMSFRAELLLSGERFEAKRLDNLIQVMVFDLVGSQSTWLTLTQVQAKILHAKLLAKLREAVDRAAGRHLEIADMSRVTLGVE